eukprot:bmy_14806T0
MDIDAERVRISKEIRELERILDPSSSSINVDVSESSLDSDSDAGKTWEKVLLRKSVVSDRLQRLLQPKLLKLEYLQQKQRSSTSEVERQVLEKQAREAEKEVQDINQLPEEALLGDRLDDHDWEKISNVNVSWGGSVPEAGVGVSTGQRGRDPRAHQTCRDPLRSSACPQRGVVFGALPAGTSRHPRRSPQAPQPGSPCQGRGPADSSLCVQFEGSRGAQEIRRFWQNCEHPSINKQAWSAQEVEQLKSVAARHGHLDWQRIAKELGVRAAGPGRRRGSAGCTSRRGQGRPLELSEGHWAKIASELPHRTGSQCLSKWKLMVRKRQRRRRGRRPPRRVRWSSSSGDSGTTSGDISTSEASEDSEPEAAPGALAGGQALLPAQHAVPDVDLWVPARQSARELWGGGAGSWPGPCDACPRPPEGSDAAQGGRWEACATASAPAEPAGQARAPSGTQSTSLRGVRWPCSADARPSSSMGPARQGAGAGHFGVWAGSRACAQKQQPPVVCQGGDVHSGSLETALQALRPTWPLGARRGAPGGQDHPDAHHPSRLPSPPHSGTQQEWRVKDLRQPHLRSAAPGPTPGGGGGRGGARPCVRPLWHRTRQRRQGHALQRRLLEHQLLTAVSPWVGEAALPPALPPAPRRPAVAHRRADGIRRRLQGAHLASTPVFTLFIQLFQIDTAGCMEVVRERKARPPTLLQAGARDSPPLQSVPARGAAKKSTCYTGSGGPQACHAESMPRAPPQAPCGPRPKPKTVSELLREKRLREARARKAAQGPAVLPPQVLVSSPVVFQPLAPQGSPVSSAVLSGPGGPVAAGSSALGSWASAMEERPLTLQAFALAPASTGALKAPAAPAASRAPGLGPGQVPVSCRPSSLGQSQAPATSRKPGVPEAPPFLPAAPSPVQLPIQPLSLTPALGTHTAASTPLPVTWVLTAQGLLSVPVQAMVGLPRPTGTPDPHGLSVTLLPSPTATQAGQGPRLPGQGHPWQPPTNTDTESDPASRTELLTLPTHPTSQSLAEVDMAHDPGGLSPGEAQVAGGTSVPRTSSQATPLADDSEAGPSGPREPRRPLGLERPPPPWSGPGKSALDLGLLSQESEAAVREWLRGQRGVHVPPLGSRLSYQPPTLCSLRALSGLLLRKKALEHRASSLVPSGAAGALQASLRRVRERLRGSPAYLLLRVRFLASFALPALLATLSPRGVPTTLSVAMRSNPGSDSDDSYLGELELVDGQPGGSAGGPQVAAVPAQGTPHPGQASAPSCPDGPDDLDVLQTRHARHARKRRRLETSQGRTATAAADRRWGSCWTQASLPTPGGWHPARGRRALPAVAAS